MTFLMWIFRALVRLVVILALVLGVSWALATSALGKLDGVVASAAPDEALPAAPLSFAQSAGLFIAAQVLPLRQPGADMVQPGRILRDCADCPEVVVIPHGYYLIGSPLFEMGRYTHFFRRLSLRELKNANREGPRRLVTVARPIGISRYQITIAQWEAAQADPNWQDWTGTEPHIPDYQLEYGPDYPMTQVDWEDAQAFAAYLSAKTGNTYRLPTDAEWEYAARAGSVTNYPWGDEIGDNNATCDGCSANWPDPVESPVGLHPANGFGLFDMNGNGVEWIEDCFVPYHAAAKTDTSAQVFEGCQFRTVRGGAAAMPGWQSRTAMRVGPHYYNDGRGLTIRLARDIREDEAAR